MKSTSVTPLFTRVSRGTRVAVFAAALVAGLSAASAVVPGYYPDPNSPVAGNVDLTLIENYLNGTTPGSAMVNPNATLVLPPPSGKTVATDKELAAATAAAVKDELVTGLPGVSVQSLVRESSQRLPAKAAVMVATVANAIIANSTGAARELAIEQATFEAAAASPKTAHVAASNVIKAIVLSPSAQGDADDAAGAAIAANKALAAKIVTSAIAASKKATTEQATAISGTSVSTAIDVGAAYLVEEITTAAVLATSKLGVPGATVGAATAAILNAVDGSAIDNAETAIQLAAAATRGASQNGTGPISGTNATAIKAEFTAEYGASSAIETSSHTAVDAFVAVRTSGSTGAAPGAAAAFVSTHASEAAAATAGAVAGWNQAADAIVAQSLDAAFANTTDDSAESIITAGVRAYPTGTAKIAKAVVDTMELDIPSLSASAGATAATGVISGTNRELVGAATFAIVKAVNDTGTIGATVTAGVNAAEARGFHNTIGALTLNAAKANKTFSSNVAAAAVAAVNLTEPSKTGAAVAGAIAADKNNAAAITSAATGARLDDDDAIITKASTTVSGILAAPLNFYNTTNAQLASAANNDQALAVVYAATIANPKGASAIAGTAVANSTVPPADILAAAQASDFKKATNVEFAVNAAVASKGAGSGVIGDYVEAQTLTNATYAVDIAIGATASAPQYAHIIGHRSAFRAPTAASKVTTALFSFAKIDSVVTDKPAAAAAIVAGVTNGILEAKLVGTKELAALKATITAAVKATLLPKGTLGYEGPMISQVGVGGSPSMQTSKGAAGVVAGYISQDYNPGGINPNRPADLTTDIDAATIGAILTAAGKAAKQYILEMAQAAAQTAASIAGPSFVGTNIINAFVAVGSTFSSTDITAAVNYGKSQAALAVPGAGAAGLVNYSHRSGTGDPVTSIFDL